ncbi:MAG: helix-turn-helix domain-containing protein [Puniceicoccales bacterium]|jgi:predicted DNA-binding transcriptional regulator AlpA|nr:helix-turn-helix domain-containing protein [Puniceicoccales bacterium]
MKVHKNTVKVLECSQNFYTLLLMANSKNHNENLLDVKDAAEFLGIKKHTLAVWLNGNKYPQLKSLKIGRFRRFLKQDLIKFIESLSQTNAEWRRKL